MLWKLWLPGEKDKTSVTIEMSDDPTLTFEQWEVWTGTNKSAHVAGQHHWAPLTVASTDVKVLQAFMEKNCTAHPLVWLESEPFSKTKWVIDDANGAATGAWVSADCSKIFFRHAQMKDIQ